MPQKCLILLGWQEQIFLKFKYDPKMDRSEDSDLIFRARLTSNYSLLDDHLVFYRIPEKIDIHYKLNQVYLLFYLG